MEQTSTMQQVKIFSRLPFDGGLKELESEVNAWLKSQTGRIYGQRVTTYPDKFYTCHHIVMISIWYEDGYAPQRPLSETPLRASDADAGPSLERSPNE